MIAMMQLRQRLACVPQERLPMQNPCRARVPARIFQSSRYYCLSAICKEPTYRVIVLTIDAGAYTRDFSATNVVDMSCVEQANQHELPLVVLQHSSSQITLLLTGRRFLNVLPWRLASPQTIWRTPLAWTRHDLVYSVLCCRSTILH